MPGIRVRARGTVEVEIEQDRWAKWAWVVGGGRGQGSGATFWDAICVAVARAIAHSVEPQPGHVVHEWRDRRDSFRVIRDQQRHIASLEAQLLPNLIREVPSEQDAML